MKNAAAPSSAIASAVPRRAAQYTPRRGADDRAERRRPEDQAEVARAGRGG